MVVFPTLSSIAAQDSTPRHRRLSAVWREQLESHFGEGLTRLLDPLGVARHPRFPVAGQRVRGRVGGELRFDLARQAADFVAGGEVGGLGRDGGIGLREQGPLPRW
jgi:hypothetical protein